MSQCLRSLVLVVAAAPNYDLFHARRGVAAVVACLAQTLNESDSTFEKRFLKRLERAYDQIRDDSEGDVRQELELLSCVRDLLAG